MAGSRRQRDKKNGTGELTTDLAGLLSDEDDEVFEAFHVPKDKVTDHPKDEDVTAESPGRRPRRSSTGNAKLGATMRRTNSSGSLTTGSTPSAMERRKSLPASPKRAQSTPRLDKRHTVMGSPTGQLLAGPPDRPKGDVSVCVRLRPGPRQEMCLFAETANCVRLRPALPSAKEDIYWCDYAFGPSASQERVYNEAVAPICESVLEGYNGAVIAYGQTGSGKTFTIIGDTATEHNKGIIPRAVGLVFEGLQRRKHWSVEVSVLEIYNERTRDLLSPTPGVTQVDIHEVTSGPGATNHDGVPSFHCPDATMRNVRTTEDAMKALFEGLKRRETARTDMNHSSSRSHLIFTLTTTQSDDALKATLRGRLHLVDLAGCERLKRSMGSVGDDKTPRERDTQRREAGAINKSLTQLALVIFRLTQPAGSGIRHVPYRDSMLTRLLADSFGGSSKTCLIINCSPSSKDREETRCALEFGKRANLVKNVAEINIEMQEEPSEIVKALVAKELAEFKREREELRGKTREAALDAVTQQRRRLEDVRALELEKVQLERQLEEARRAMAESQAAAAADVQSLQEQNRQLRRMLESMVSEAARAHDEKVALQRQLRQLLQGVVDQVPPSLEEARAAVAEPEARLASPPRGSPPRGSPRTSDGDSDDDEEAQGSDTQPLAAVQQQRLSTLEAELQTLQSRWADVLAQPPPGVVDGDREDGNSGEEDPFGLSELAADAVAGSDCAE